MNKNAFDVNGECLTNLPRQLSNVNLKLFDLRLKSHGELLNQTKHSTQYTHVVHLQILFKIELHALLKLMAEGEKDSNLGINLELTELNRTENRV